MSMTQSSDPEEGVGVQFGSYHSGKPVYEGHRTESVYVPMSDGVGLAADVTLPKNLPPGTRIPALLTQTRYWRRMELRAPFKWFLTPEALNPHFKDFAPYFTSHGYALVSVDVRGSGASFGTWRHPWAEECMEDARETIDWIVSQDWSNGKVGAWGISYLGTTAELLAALDHPAVQAVIPMFNHPDAYIDIAFPGGIFDERFIKAWGYFDLLLDQNVVPPDFGLAGRMVVKGVKPVDSDKNGQLLSAAVREHRDNGNAYALASLAECRDDQPEDIPIRIDDITVHRFKEEIERSGTALCGWASWMDAGTADAAIRRFLTYDGAQMTVIGAWEHGGRFNASPYRPPDAPASPTLPSQWQEMHRFFDAYLKEVDNGVRARKTLFYYTMGEEVWKKTGVWPPEGTEIQRWYLAEGEALLRSAPEAESGADSYTVDFSASTGDSNRWWEMGVLEDKTVMYGDRAEADKLLLTYTSQPLEKDTEITGYPIVSLHVTSTEEDGAFFVYLEDVDEQGRVTYVTEGQLRASHRKISEETPPYGQQVPYHSFKRADMMPLVPGEQTELAFGLLSTSVLIRKGHRLRLAIAGHDEGTFVRIPAQGTPTIRVSRNRNRPSHIELPVATRG
jgi:putative CocE/NonD family hydrolase